MLVPKTRGALFPAKVTTESYHFILSMAIAVGWGVAPRREREIARLRGFPAACLLLFLGITVSSVWLALGARWLWLLHSF